MYYSHIEFPELAACGYESRTVEDPRASFRLMDGRARLAARNTWSGRSDFVVDPRDLLADDSEAPWLLRFACAASRVRLA